MNIQILLLCICAVLANPYSDPQLIDIPIQLSTQLSTTITEKTQCTSMKLTSIYTSAFIFDSIKNHSLLVSSNTNNVTFSIFLEDANNHTCNKVILGIPIKIETNVQYKLVVYSTELTTELININLDYVPEQDADGTTVTIKDLPFFRYITIPHYINETKDSCSSLDKDQESQGIYGDVYTVDIDEDLVLEINTCGYSDGLNAIHVIYENGGKCLKLADSYSTEDLQCASGLGARVSVDIHPSSPLKIYAGFIVPSVNDRSFLLNITKIGDAKAEQKEWEMWMWFGIITAVIVIFCTLVMGTIIVYAVIKRKKERQNDERKHFGDYGNLN
ncbi:hypothetical protein EHI8A_028570 [Entamoeba histolytica HM-1:IMSS-B]|uniref:Uncharacterized protein n=6 Tax=Entamoeba histolytica TaxID=5759 RepID=C4LYE6_ENTH1|nr:hypothetical protein EHI_008120 [Entamoeba histolytica HM-1:IMSS]EMD49783.1 Hypothetical protein EHI5A_055220 [Entamoeba histolytica KU27]EMH78242.1 hypothetical protein EHI8A_028570 [Entamoeba histolytica HM-1:IMSS-B]EMS11747.1 hypothetical protein KM1_065990 [Entamoeba histolytica HM-3:IMSS]ENY64095.1 hypothetical protein EHI7A_031130 [Entamoeba histolytica HM-1:IMSS-A]GAT93841.1 hypothetical protein CL6EHI_008120 [Entamoeba histolytica]|eukprot:XP_654389.1 hypothetical protein EHI_008120 [Entamoeba histolytica HM-1:IMSS]